MKRKRKKHLFLYVGLREYMVVFYNFASKNTPGLNEEQRDKLRRLAIKWEEKQ